MSKQKLELTWVGKDVRPRLEPRVLLEDASKSFVAAHRVSDADLFGNKLIFGDNLLALKALEQELAGQVKCVFIDPPYNTGSAFEHYDDGLEHSLWLSMMRDRLELLKGMLRDDGSIWITLDDSESHYAKVLCDEIFGRINYVATCVWEKDKGGRGDADISLSHDNIIIFAKNKELWGKERNLLPRTETQLSRFKNPDNDPRGPWRQGDDGTAKSGSEKQRFEITLPSGRIVTPPKGRYWAFAKNTLEVAKSENRAYFGVDGDRLPIIKRYLTEVREGVAPRTWWSADEVGTNQEAKRDHLAKLLPDIVPFSTPKPERLLERILHIATNPGDLVLDSFGGSGTTGAVAHKMGRRWVMVELQDTAHTHIIPRLRKVIEGTDLGGITQSVGWTGGGGFQYLRLAPSLIVKDRFGQEIINPEFNPEMLIEALCKLEGFVYAPSLNREEYWIHGRSTEQDFLYVTTQHLTFEQLQVLSDDVGERRSLLVMCSAFEANAGSFGNLTVKKIPQAILHKCEWGKDDYSLRVQNVPMLDPDTTASLEVASAFRAKGVKRSSASSPSGAVTRERKDAGLTSLFDSSSESQLDSGLVSDGEA